MLSHELRTPLTPALMVLDDLQLNATLSEDCRQQVLLAAQNLQIETQLIDDLLDLSAVEVEQDGRRALLRSAPRPSIDPICRALGLTLPPVFQEMPTDKAGISAD